MTAIKLCGMMCPEDIDTVNLLQPEYVGFVFAPKSRRFVSDETAAALRAQLAPSVSAVGVFVQENISHILQLAEAGIIQLIQLHGGEDENYIAELRKQTKLPIIRAFRIENREDLSAAARCSADHILLDAGTGGTGKVFDWSVLTDFHRPYFLAGGLNCENIREAMLRLSPRAVDVSSGIETDGRKDSRKMMEFVNAVRTADGKDRHL